MCYSLSYLLISNRNKQMVMLSLWVLAGQEWAALHGFLFRSRKWDLWWADPHSGYGSCNSAWRSRSTMSAQRKHKTKARATGICPLPEEILSHIRHHKSHKVKAKSYSTPSLEPFIACKNSERKPIWMKSSILRGTNRMPSPPSGP